MSFPFSLFHSYSLEQNMKDLLANIQPKEENKKSKRQQIKEREADIS